MQPGAREQEDQRLVAGIRNRDSECLRELFDFYLPRVYHFAMRRLGDPSAAEEVASDVFFEVWRSVEAFRGESRVSTWIFGIAHFKCAAALRRRGRLKRASIVPVPDETLANLAEAPERPEARVDARAALRTVGEQIDALPPDQRRLLEMAWIEGRSYDEIAEQLSVPAGTVKTRVARARARLRERSQWAPKS